MKRIFITGGAGFIGSSCSIKLIERGYELIVLDNFNDYYNPTIKEKNIREVQKCAEEYNTPYKLIRGDVRDKDIVDSIFVDYEIDAVIAWAANAGVRPSIENPKYYVDVNINGLMNILEGMRNNNVKNLVFISSSSVYGNNDKVPFTETDSVDNPISPYAATKKAGELLCHTYHELFNIDVHCLRYFTVYGPKQRPDLAINKFTRLMLANEEIPMFGDGSTSRDYTYIDDIVDGTISSLEYLITNDDVYDVFNLGGSNPISLIEMINVIGKTLNVTPKIKRLPMQAGDVNMTYSDYSHAKKVLGYSPKVSFEYGMKKYVEWYLNEFEEVK